MEMRYKPMSEDHSQTEDISLHDTSKPIWESRAKSPIIKYAYTLSKFKLKLKYGGYFRLTKNSCRQIYCFGSQKCIHIDTFLYRLSQLHQEVVKRYSSKNNTKFSVLYVDKYAPEKSLIELGSDEKFMAMLGMYGSEKQVTIYVTTENNLGANNHTNHLCANRDEPHDEYDADLFPSEESYHSHRSSDNEDGIMNDDDEVYSFSKNSTSMEVGSKFENVVDFRRALNHFAVTNEFNYYIQKSDPARSTARCENLECKWRIHVSITQDEVTFEVKKMGEVHTCTHSNKGGNKRATQGWIANVVTDKLKSDGDVSPYELRNWIMKTYNVDVSYLKGFRRKEQAYTDMYAACSRGFLAGCRPYIGLDACHLKGKFNGVLAATTGIDGNNSIFPMAYCVLESENTQSWTWFLDSLKKAIGTPNGLVISSDVQKGLEVAMMNVYPNVEDRECIRHLYSNFKKHFRGDFFNTKLWATVKTYRSTKHDTLLKEISDKNDDVIAYLNTNHKKYGVKASLVLHPKTFNSWIGKLRYKLVLDLLDAIKEKIMKRFNKKRNLNLGEYEVTRSCENQDEVKYKGTRWEVSLDERKCSCRVWQVRGRPCVHAAAFIAFIRDANWDKYLHMLFKLLRCPDRINGHKKMWRKYVHLLSNAHLDDQEKTELNHQMSLKEDTNVRDVESTDTVKGHVKIQHLKVLIKVKHPHLKGNVETIQNRRVVQEFRGLYEKSLRISC
uniref:SWIM-type domain-containing protein n=1 Tax=Lactuca sativa TaxID=4236 RepID=A0A9R1VZW1_LACSA|nr:hypothetical protein LSAT_V11C400201180 [Lactuca sativa]